MRIQARKVMGDLRGNVSSIALLALVLALGAGGVVAARDARAVLTREIAQSYDASRSPDIALWFDAVDPTLLAAVASQDGVAGVAARRVAFTRIKVRDGSWLPLRLTIVPDLASQQVGLVHRHGEDLPDGDGVLVLEQSASGMIAERTGQMLSIRTPSGATASVALGGFVHDTAVAPSTQERLIYAYANPAAAALLEQNPVPDQLLVKMQSRANTEAAIQLGGELAAVLRKSNRPPLRVDALPNMHPHALLMSAMLRVLTVVCAMALVCGGALAGALVTGWTRRQSRQIGIMKTLGASSSAIAVQFLALFGPFVVLAVAIGVPLGAMLGHALVSHYATSLNIDVRSWDVPPSLRFEEIALTLLLPLGAVAWAVARASRMTALAAIADTVISAPPVSRIARATRMHTWLRFPGAMRWTFALRNSWRRPWRLMLILLALTLGGALMLGTRSNYESLMAVIDEALARQAQDIEVILQRPAPPDRLEAIARGVPDVQIAEAWQRASISMTADESGVAAVSEARRVALTGFPVDTRLFSLPIVEGRAPRRDVVGEVLISRSMRDPYPELHVGSRAVAHYRDRTLPVQVVGLIEEIGSPVVYAERNTFDAITALGGANALRIKAGGVALEAIAASLDQALLDAHLAPNQILTRTVFRDALDEHLKVVGDVLRMVALAAALVGAIMLAAATALNVLERKREIGVMRAIGASPRAIGGVFIAEAGAIAIAGAVLAILIAIALTFGLNHMAANGLLRVAVPFHFSMHGLLEIGAGALVVLIAVLIPLRLTMRRPALDALHEK